MMMLMMMMMMMMMIIIIIIICKLKCTLVQALRLCTGRTAHWESKGIALLFLDHGTRRGCGVSVTPQPLFTPVKDPVPIVQETGWAPGPISDRCGKSRSTGIRSPDRPARNQSLYRLSHPAYIIICRLIKYFKGWHSANLNATKAAIFDKQFDCWLQTH